MLGSLLNLLQFDIPLSEEWLTWQKHVHRYGDLVYLTVLGRNYLLLGSQRAVIELLEKRSYFNDRPHMTMISELYVLVIMLRIVNPLTRT
jgi:hypothetical protein